MVRWRMRRAQRRHRDRLIAGVVAVLVTACGASPGVQTESARQAAPLAAPTEESTPSTLPPEPTTSDEPATPTDEPTPTAEAPPTDEPAPTDDTAPTDPPPTAEPTPTDEPVAPTDVPTTSVEPRRDLLDVGDAKTPRVYDDLIRAALADLELWWNEEFPRRYGAPFEPLRGSVYAAYPERTDPIPGCGTSRPTTYEEISQYGAFFCQDGDFMVYDDGDQGVLASLAAEFGPPILGVVLAHEYGHVVQSRAGDFDRGLPTVVTEQQADCFAGAWVARAVRGEAAGVSFADADVRTGLIAMIAVRDPKGIDQLDRGGHGSAFDRVGAFQVGYVDGLERCVELLDDPLPLVPNEYSPNEDPSLEGNSPFGYLDGEIGYFLPRDLNAFWAETLSGLGAELGSLALVPVADAGAASCREPAGDIAVGAVFCPPTGEIIFDESFGLELYDRFGDFAVGYMLGAAWSEAVQRALDSPLEGEERALASDCLTGAWVGDIIPIDGVAPRNVFISPGDLDEAIQTALVVGDPGSSDDVFGSGFEKIASFRQGVLEGIPACIDRLDD